MKRLILTLCFILAMAFSVSADTVNLHWDGVEKATGYKIYMSSDFGVEWNGGIDVGDVASYKCENVPESGLILFRVSAYNNAGEAIRHDFGTWYNGDWKPLDPVNGIGISE